MSDTPTNGKPVLFKTRAFVRVVRWSTPAVAFFLGGGCLWLSYGSKVPEQEQHLEAAANSRVLVIGNVDRPTRRLLRGTFRSVRFRPTVCIKGIAKPCRLPEHDVILRAVRLRFSTEQVRGDYKGYAEFWLGKCGSKMQGRANFMGEGPCLGCLDGVFYLPCLVFAGVVDAIALVTVRHARVRLDEYTMLKNNGKLIARSKTYERKYFAHCLSPVLAPFWFLNPSARMHVSTAPRRLPGRKPDSEAKRRALLRFAHENKAR